MLPNRQPVVYCEDTDSLSRILQRCGYTHRKAPKGFDLLGASREVVDATGTVVFTGRYEQTLEWLHSTGQARPASKEVR